MRNMNRIEKKLLFFVFLADISILLRKVLMKFALYSKSKMFVNIDNFSRFIARIFN
jgi:hypothetical protein